MQLGIYDPLTNVTSQETYKILQTKVRDSNASTPGALLGFARWPSLPAEMVEGSRAPGPSTTGHFGIVVNSTHKN